MSLVPPATSTLSSADKAEAEPEHIFVEKCWKCSFEYEYKLVNGKSITIVCGRPDPAVGKYRALSYVWERTTLLPLKCRKCLQTTEIPMRDAEKFRGIMTFLRGDCRIWIDALSIDQSNLDDKAAQLPVMGEIYRHAETVSVFLPQADNAAYCFLKHLSKTSAEIVKNYTAFAELDQGEITTKLAQAFSWDLDAWLLSLEAGMYFQGWCLASEIDISYENAPGNEGMSRIKNVIVEASTIVGQWRKMSAKAAAPATEPEGLLQQVHLRDDVGFVLNAVRTLFPFEGLLVGDREEEMDDMRTSILATPMPLATDSGTYVGMKTEGKKSPPFRSMLDLTLNAMGASRREASNQAGLIACWASACNIKYPYDIKDTFEVALHKVIFALRQRGIRIYNFHANTDSGETDLDFLEYAATYRQTNAKSGGYLYGAPISVGRADTVFHVNRLLMQSEEVKHLPAKTNIQLREISKAVIKRPIPWSNPSRAISTFRTMISGKADEAMISDVVDLVEHRISKMEETQLSEKLLVVVQIGADDIHTMWRFNAWVIIPSKTPLQDLFVARESLNGTLVLAVYMAPERDLRLRPYTRDDPREKATQARIVAYLNTTHVRDGTFLLKSNDVGVLDIVFRTADTPEHDLFWIPEQATNKMDGGGLIPGWDVTDALKDRVLGLKISFGGRLFSVKALQPNA